MFVYATLDAIADTYIPVLAFVVLCCIGATARRGDMPQLKRQSLSFLYGLTVAYGLMFMDNKLQLWPVLGLDYSTHTAVSFVLNFWLILFVRKLWFIWGTLLIAYFILMRVQGYHSLMDIVSTLLVVGLLCFPIIVRYTSVFRR